MNELIKLYEKLFLHGIISVLLAMLAAGYGFWIGRHRLAINAPPTVSSIKPTVIQLERLGQLTTARIHIMDVLSANGEGYRGSWLVSGDALLACDASKACIENVNEVRRTATIRLPVPQVISARVNHDLTKTWNVERTTWLPWKWGDQSVLRDAAMYHAEKLIESAASSEHHLTSAQRQAEAMIQQLYEFLEWNVEVQWDGPLEQTNLMVTERVSSEDK
ncbi:DUF4230 domain-containing protein [Schlesneria paludicola]|uniref:DUF4230 domain-containing protein n=1 Tax=Schlesneria paludicola TaxID=360056 RepID=UPI00029ABAEE|nr:DUF4230 domain-containing protein [Schlesneria paludicola]